MKKTILLAGPSAAGKSTLAKALAHGDQRFVVSTSAHLRSITGASSPGDLYTAGQKLDKDNPNWLYNLVQHDLRNTVAVIDAVRSHEQHNSFHGDIAVRVNVVADDSDLGPRHDSRGTKAVPTPFMFNRPDFVWNSSRVSLATATQAINQLSGGGYVDVLIGGQFGSEGKGKLAAILAPSYDVLVRSGGPNAGHWVRTDDYEFCFHHLPSGTLANRTAAIWIAAGATLYPPKFWEEVADTHCASRLVVDRNAMLIEEGDRERESQLVGMVGSTAQGVGAAQARRILRGLDGSVRTAWDDERFRPHTTDVSSKLHHAISAGQRVLVEGTQGAMLSLFHGEYPFTTSRDTNVSGLLSEAGIPPCHVRNTWMVVRSHPIRVGGNSGPMEHELQWADVALRAGRDTGQLMGQELTSTTKRQRRVGEFSWNQYRQVVAINRPTRIFLSFADYIHPQAAGIRDFRSLPDEVHKFVERLEAEAGVPVAGISTGRSQGDVAMRWGYVS